MHKIIHTNNVINSSMYIRECSTSTLLHYYIITYHIKECSTSPLLHYYIITYHIKECSTSTLLHYYIITYHIRECSTSTLLHYMYYIITQLKVLVISFHYYLFCPWEHNGVHCYYCCYCVESLECV